MTTPRDVPDAADGLLDGRDEIVGQHEPAEPPARRAAVPDLVGQHEPAEPPARRAAVPDPVGHADAGRAAPPLDAVVLAGGRGSRLGGTAKPDVVVAGVALVDHVLAALGGARAVVLVGPPEVARPGVARVLEDPPFGGPVAGIAAGLAHLGSTVPDDDALVAVLSCDVPRAGRALSALVVAADGDGVDGARLMTADGRPQNLVAVYRRRALAAAVAALPTVRDVAVRTLVAPLRLVDVPDEEGASADVDTWDDAARLDAELRGGTITP